MPPTFREINFSPFATNVLDVVGDSRLCRPDGSPVQVMKGPRLFRVFIGGKLAIESDDNIEVSHCLNTAQVGRMS